MDKMLLGVARKSGVNTSKLDNGAVLSVMQKPGNADQALCQAEALRRMVDELQEIRCMLEHREESCKARRPMLEE